MKKIKPINVLLILIIIILLSFIILPPVLRATIKDVNLSDNNTTIASNNLSVLSCQKLDTANLYKISSRSRYKDETLMQNTITYEKLESLTDTVSSNDKVSLKSPEEEIAFFSSINGISINTVDSTTRVTIIKAAVEANNANDTLLKYFNDKETQKEFYENQGYVCEEIKN